MWNYNFIPPYFIILVTFLIYYFFQPRLPVKLNKSFLGIIIVDLLVVFSDLAASLSLDYLADSSVFYLKTINIVYFLFFQLRTFLFFHFTQSVMGAGYRRRSFTNESLSLIFIVSEGFVLLNYFFPTIFAVSDEGKYSYGPFYNVIYICAFFYIIMSFLVIYTFRKQRKPRTVLAISAVNFTMLVGYIVRIIFPQYLVMNLFCLTAIIIIYLSFENPTIYLSGKGKSFNKKALYNVLEETGEKESPLVLGFILHNYNEMREIYGGAQMDKGVEMIDDFLAKKYPKLLRFYLRDGRFVLVGKDNSLLESIREEIKTRFTQPWYGDEDVDLYLEVGFAQLDHGLHVEKSDLIVRTILEGLREAESLDNSCVTIGTDTIKQIERNTYVKQSVEHAVESNQVELYFQPLMDATTHKIVGAEALARIRDMNGSIIPPGEFIPIAETNGKINHLGQQMFEHACKFISTHNLDEAGISWINVNLSPIQFLRSDLNSRFMAILEKYKVPAEKIHLEITEESMIDYALLQKQIQSMRRSGFQFVLDDYGCGYSNVSRLKRCPFINVKLDMEIVLDYFRDRDKILPTLVQTFKEMNFTVTAEGVETLEIAEAMRDIGCNFLQGFYFSKPLPAEEFAKKYLTQA